MGCSLPDVAKPTLYLLLCVVEGLNRPVGVVHLFAILNGFDNAYQCLCRMVCVCVLDLILHTA